MKYAVAIAVLGCGVSACIQANPDYLGQEGSTGPASSGGGATQTSTLLPTGATTTAETASSDTGRDSTSGSTADQDDTTGRDPTTGSVGRTCAEGRAGFCYLAPTCIATQMGEPSRTAVGDVDEDGDLDVVAVGRTPDAVQGFANDGAGGLTEAFFAEIGGRPEDVALLDLDGADEPELLVAARDDDAVRSFSIAGGVVEASVDYPVGNRPVALAIADVSGDARPDVVVAVRDSNAVVILEAQPNGTLIALEAHPVGDRPEDVAVGDVDGDRVADIVTANEAGGGVSLSFGAGDGMFLAATEVLISPMGRAVALGDLDGTAGLDIASVASSVDGVSLLKTMGTMVEAPVTVPAGQEPRDVVARDLNSDGAIDLAVAHSGESALYVFAGQGDGTFESPLTIGLSAPGYGVSAGDLNGDMIPDLVATAPDVGQICIVLSSAEG